MRRIACRYETHRLFGRSICRGFLLLAGVLLACGVSPRVLAIDETDSDPKRTDPWKRAREARATGSEKAPLLIEEFSDFECGYCRVLTDRLASVLKSYKGQVRRVFRNYPLTSIHPNAPLLHRGVLAAGRWSKFWEMHEEVFARRDKLDSDALVEIATALGLPAEEFRPLLASRELQKIIDEDVREGRKRGVRGTPTLFIGETRLTGLQREDVLEYYIRRELGLDAKLPANLSSKLLAKDPEPKHPLATGPVDSKNVVKVFIDLRSPLGKQAAPKLRSMVKRYSDRARIVIKLAPTGIYSDSELTHQLAVALVDRGGELFRFWEASARWKQKIKSTDIPSWAAAFGVEGQAGQDMLAQISNKVYLPTVRQDAAEAKRHRFKGSPTALANGKRFDGLKGLDELDAWLAARPPEAEVKPAPSKPPIDLPKVRN